MKKLTMMLTLVASMYAQTWTCSTLSTDKTEHEVVSTLAVKGAALTLAIKGVDTRSYHFTRDNLEGDRFFLKDKGEGMVLLGGLNPDIIVVLDSSDTYVLSGCAK
jgi:hypothetical protein